MFEVNVNIHCPDLALAADKLAMAINHRAGSVEAAAAVLRSEAPTLAAPITPKAVQAPAQAPAVATPSAPAQAFTPPVSRPAPAPVISPAPVPAPATVAPTYTHEQVGRAGADLVAANPAMMPTLMSLLQRYGVQLVTDLKPDQLGPFAVELRGLGARI